MLQRARELESWIGDFSLPASVWLGGFFNPQSFLTAIMQQTARKVNSQYKFLISDRVNGIVSELMFSVPELML